MAFLPFNPNFNQEEQEQLILKDSMSILNTRILKTIKKYNICENILLQLQEKYSRDKKKYEGIDYELAMIDGRYQKSQIKVGEKGKKQVAQFTSEQIGAIAAALGLDLEGHKTLN